MADDILKFSPEEKQEVIRFQNSTAGKKWLLLILSKEPQANQGMDIEKHGLMAAQAIGYNRIRRLWISLATDPEA